MSSKDLTRGQRSGYFSLDTILASEIRVSCRVQTRIPKCGFLAPEYFSEDLEPGTVLQLPLWAVKVLCRPSGPKQPHFISIIELPTCFKDALWEVMEDDPKSVDLRRFHEQYFEAGEQCSGLKHPEAENLAEMIMEMLRQRIICVGEGSIEGPEKLEALELELYKGWAGENQIMEEWVKPVSESLKDDPEPDLLPETQQQSESEPPQMMETKEESETPQMMETKEEQSEPRQMMETKEESEPPQMMKIKEEEEEETVEWSIPPGQDEFALAGASASTSEGAGETGGGSEAAPAEAIEPGSCSSATTENNNEEKAWVSPSASKAPVPELELSEQVMTEESMFDV